MKKYFVSFVFLVLFAGYATLQYLSTSNSTAAPVALTTTTAPTQSTIVVASAAPPPSDTESDSSSNDSNATSQETQTTPTQTETTPTAAAAPTQATGQYTDGTYTGSPENAFYGTVQVQVTISGGTIADVQFLQYPNDRSTSQFINQQAMPILTREAIQAQSANVDGVSGASDTSAAFRESLASALAQA